jgi:hypothetical protein
MIFQAGEVAASQQKEEDHRAQSGKAQVVRAGSGPVEAAESDTNVVKRRVVRGVMLASSAVCVISSIMAYHYMTQADAAYDHYLNAGKSGQDGSLLPADRDLRSANGHLYGDV